MNTIDAMEDAIMEKIHYWYDSQETDAPQEMGALRSGIRAALARDEAQTVEPVPTDVVAAVNALLHQIDIGDFVDGHGHSAKMLKPVHDLMKLLAHPATPPSGEQDAVEGLRTWDGITERETLIAFALECSVRPNSIGDKLLFKCIAGMLAADAQRGVVNIETWQDRIRKNHPASDPQYWPDELIAKYARAEVDDLRGAVDRLQSDAQQVAVPQVFGALIGIAAWLLSPEPLRLLGELLENKHISRRQFSKALTTTNEAYRLKAIEIKGLSDKLAAAPTPPQAERVPMTEAELACIDVFNDFSEGEVKAYAPSVRLAWEAGKSLAAHHGIKL